MTAVASTILFGDDFARGISEIDLRRLARLYHDSPRKRLEAEFYFTGGCKLLQRRILRLEDGRHAGMPAPASTKLDMHPRAYRAIMGRSEPAADCGSRMRPRRPSRDEEERNAAAVFRRAEKEDAILFFDEADSFFYARHDVSHATDVSDNRTVNIILTCLENHTLPVILTTNRADALDPALERRLTLKVHFGMPGPEERERIWRLHLPENAPLADDVNIERLAERYELAGGHIKNAVLSAARRAVARVPDAAQALITMQELERACRDEMEGKGFSEGLSRKVGFLA